MDIPDKITDIPQIKELRLNGKLKMIIKNIFKKLLLFLQLQNQLFFQHFINSLEQNDELELLNTLLINCC